MLPAAAAAAPAGNALNASGSVGINSDSSLAPCPSLFPSSTSSSSSSSSADPSTRVICDNNAPVMGFLLTLFLAALCFWRLVVFTSIASRYRWWPRAWSSYDFRPSTQHSSTRGAGGEAGAASEQTLLLLQQQQQQQQGSPSRPRPPTTLVRRLVFHLVLFLAVVVDIPR